MTQNRQPFQPTTPAEMAVLFSPEKLEYLSNKARGGNNGYKGSRYEQFFAAHRIARLARTLLEKGIDSDIHWQSDGFVDDVIVRRQAMSDVKAYQLKNSNSVSWTASSGQIANDFADQYAVSTFEGYASVRLRLVCNDEEVATALCSAVPEKIAAFSKAIYFPYSEPHRLLISQFRWMQDDFAFLSNRENAKLTQAEQVASVLMGAWSSLAPHCTVREVLSFARDTSPAILRTLQTDEEAAALLTQEARNVLDTIDGLTYTVKRGFFTWSDPTGTTSGVLPYDCFSALFQNFQRRILDQKPRSFSQIEEML